MNRLHTLNPTITNAATASTILSAAIVAIASSERLANAPSCETVTDPPALFRGRKFHPSQSMAFQRVADMSSVRGFRASGMEVGVCIAQNTRPYQEDSWVVLGNREKPAMGWKGRWPFKTDPQNQSSPSSFEKMAVLAIFDGHGGDACSMYASHQFQKTFEKELRKSDKVEVRDALENTLLDLDRSFVSKQRRATDVPQDAVNSLNQGGSTAVVVAVDPEKKKITCSNVGDSRAILIKSGNDPLPLSDDHSPNLRPDEVARILDLGGVIESSPDEKLLALMANVELCPRVYHKNGIGGLNMTRALGDDYLKPLVIPDPETTITPIDHGDACVVLASDGVWDVMSNQDVAELVLKVRADVGDTASASEVVMWSALLIVQYAQQKGSKDNITCVVVQLPPLKKKA